MACVIEHGEFNSWKAVLRRYDAMANTLLKRSQNHPTLLPVIMEFKQRVSGYLNDDGDDD